MNIEKIELMASRGEALDKLNIVETAAFLSFRALYREYRAGGVTREQAKAEKTKIIDAYDHGMLFMRVYEEDVKRWNAFSSFATEMNLHGCDMCKKAVAILDGRERVME